MCDLSKNSNEVKSVPKIEGDEPDESSPLLADRASPVYIVIEENGDELVIQSPVITSTTCPLKKSNLEIRPSRNLVFPVARPPVRPFHRNIQFRIHGNIHRMNHNPREISKNDELKVIGTKYALLSVSLIFICSLSALLFVYTRFPKLEEDEKKHVKLPWDIEEAKQLGIVLDKYKERYFFEVLSGIFVTYIFLQTFAIPGSLFLSILSGFLFPFMVALTLVCVCSAIGASLCYLLSQLVGRRLVKKFFPERASKWAKAVNKHRDHIFNYILFLRMTPFLPNWFINLTAPVIGVPLIPFALGTFLGVGPPSFVAIQAGQTLYKMTNSSGVFSWTSVILLAVFALLSLVPVVLKQRLREKFE